MGRSMTIGIGITAALIVFVFVIAYSDNYHAETTILIKPNDTTTAVQADHVINNIAVIPERDAFTHDLIEDLSETTINNWNEHIRTKRAPDTGYITINIRSASFEQSEAIAIAAVRLWIENIQEYYKITDEVEVKIVAHELRRGSWREFTLAIIFSLLIGILIALIVSLVRNTFTSHTKKRSPKPLNTTPKPQSHVPETTQVSTNESVHDTQQNEAQRKFSSPTFIKQLEVDNESISAASHDEEDARLRLHHARAQKRNFIAATTKAKPQKSLSDESEEVKDVFDTYKSFQHPLGGEGIGKSPITDAAPENLPIVETTMAFGDIPANLPIIKRDEKTENQIFSADQIVTPEQSDNSRSTKNAAERLEKVALTPKKKAEAEKPKEEPQTEKIPEDLPMHTSNRQTSDAPPNLPIVGVTGKTTAAEIQENKSEFTFTAPKVVKEKEIKKNSAEPIDLEREPTDEELKTRLNQLLKGNFKTK